MEKMEVGCHDEVACPYALIICPEEF